MSNTMRWRYGDTNPVVAAVGSATVIEIGDLLYLDEDDAKPASMFPVRCLPAGSGLRAEIPIEIAKGGFVKKFLGVAMQRSRAGDTDPVRVATTGVFEFDCPAATFELGDLVGVNEASSGTELEDQQVVGVSLSKYAIARVAKRVPAVAAVAAVAASVLVDVRSTVMTGGIAGSVPADAIEE